MYFPDPVFLYHLLRLYIDEKVRAVMGNKGIKKHNKQIIEVATHDSDSSFKKQFDKLLKGAPACTVIYMCWNARILKNVAQQIKIMQSVVTQRMQFANIESACTRTHTHIKRSHEEYYMATI